MNVTEIPLSAPQAARGAIEQASFAHGPDSAVTTAATIERATIPEITVTTAATTSAATTSAAASTGVQQAFWAAIPSGGTQVWSPPTNAPPPTDSAVRLPPPDPAQRLPQPDGMLRLPAVSNYQ